MGELDAALHGVIPVHHHHVAVHHRRAHVEQVVDVLHDRVDLATREACPVHQEAHIVDLAFGILAAPGIEHHRIEADQVVVFEEALARA